MDLLRTATDWLAPLRSTVPELTGQDWKGLARLQELLSTLAPEYRQTGNRATRSAGLLRTRRELARHGFAMRCPSTADRGGGPAAALQVLRQFVCGFHDADLRDATGPAHGVLATRLRSRQLRERWLDRLREGALIGIALSERHGGTRVRELTATAYAKPNQRWALHVEKTHISRLHEADAFVVFFRDPYGTLSAALVDAAFPGLSREELEPVGLRGWSWGILRMEGVEIDPAADLIGEPGAGHALQYWHFTRYRPLVAATVAGAAAGGHSEVAAMIAARQRIGVIDQVRDHALDALGHSHQRIYAALQSAITTARLAATGDEAAATLWARLGKAYAVDEALTAVRELSPLVGAVGYRASSPLAKARGDLEAFEIADGINQEMYRSGGKSLLGW